MMPLAIKIIILFELFATLFALLKVFNFLPSAEIILIHEKLILFVSVMPCFVAVVMLLMRHQHAVAAVIVSWFTVNLSSLVLGDNIQIERHLYLIVGFVSLSGVILFIYLKKSPSIKSYFSDAKEAAN